MRQSFSDSRSPRLVFSGGTQRQWFIGVRARLGHSWLSVARVARVHRRSLSDWYRGKYSTPLSVAQRLRAESRLPFPKNVVVKQRYWYVAKGARKAGRLVWEKYGTIGDPVVRRRRWNEWWEREGRNRLAGFFSPRDIRYPSKGRRLAEFVGIMLGDGGITERQVVVTLNAETDAAYSRFVWSLLRELFGTTPRLYRRERIVNVTISRTRLVKLCQSLGLKVGSKVRQGADIPLWIFERRSFVVACLRGLMDTDGCIFQECHRINGTKYCYPRLSLVSLSPPLRASMMRALAQLGFTPKLRNNRSVQLEKRDEIVRYFRFVGSHNPKHLARAARALGRVG